jgi:hypothetical protein
MLKADKVLVVERVIESLGLQVIRDSLVGTVEQWDSLVGIVEQRGISALRWPAQASKMWG